MSKDLGSIAIIEQKIRIKLERYNGRSFFDHKARATYLLVSRQYPGSVKNIISRIERIYRPYV